jgi:hypothetical protein
MVAAFLIEAASAVVVLAIFGVGERGTMITLRLTASWSFSFWLAYAGERDGKPVRIQSRRISATSGLHLPQHKWSMSVLCSGFFTSRPERMVG